MMPVNHPRRRFITIAAAAALVGPSFRPQRPFTWSGQAMGAEASITLYHSDQRQAEAVLNECQAEIQQVERLFSLFRRDSCLVQLNRQGRLDRAPPLFRHLVQVAGDFSALSHGAFDVTVQPLWALYSRHFAKPDPDPDGPSPSAIAHAASLVDWRGLTVRDQTVELARPGMAVTFNGIAQGLAADRVAELLRAREMTNVLLDVGEMRAMGGHPDGRPWMVGIADPAAPDRILQRVELHQAMASSGGYGTVFDPAGRFHHLFDPASGRPWSRWAGVTVLAPTAMVADALTKAVALAPLDQAAGILRDGGGVKAVLVAANGAVHQLIAQRS